MLNDETFLLAGQLTGALKQTILDTNFEPGKEVQIDAFVNQTVPTLISVGQTALADGTITFSEAVLLITAVSSAVRDGLNIYNDSNNGDKLIVVREIVQFIFNKLYPKDDGLKKLINDDSTINGFINILYRLNVKPRR